MFYLFFSRFLFIAVSILFFILILCDTICLFLSFGLFVDRLFNWFLHLNFVCRHLNCFGYFDFCLSSSQSFFFISTLFVVICFFFPLVISTFVYRDRNFVFFISILFVVIWLLFPISIFAYRYLNIFIISTFSWFSLTFIFLRFNFVCR